MKPGQSFFERARSFRQIAAIFLRSPRLKAFVTLAVIALVTVTLWQEVSSGGSFARRLTSPRNLYGRLATHYARFERKEMSAEALLKERARVFRSAERALAWRRGTFNNVGMASEMTYSRHFPLSERVHAALGSDLARTVEFFRRVDAAKPSPAAFMKARNIASKESVAFIRGYEAEIVKIIEAALAGTTRR